MIHYQIAVPLIAVAVILIALYIKRPKSIVEEIDSHPIQKAHLDKQRLARDSSS